MSQQARLGMYFGVNVHTASLFFAPESTPDSKDALPDLRQLRISFTNGEKHK